MNVVVEMCSETLITVAMVRTVGLAEALFHRAMRDAVCKAADDSPLIQIRQPSSPVRMWVAYRGAAESNLDP